VAISYRSYAVAGVTSTDIVISKPSGTVDGDMMVAFIALDNDDTISSVPSGWNEIDNGVTGNTLRLASYYKEAGGSEPSSYTWVASESDDNIGFIVTSQKGGSETWDPPNESAEHSIAFESIAIDTITTGSVTTETGDILLCGFTHDGNATVDIAPSGMTLTEVKTQASAFTAAVYYEESVSAGSPTKTIDWSSNDQLGAAAVVLSVTSSSHSASPSASFTIQAEPLRKTSQHRSEYLHHLRYKPSH
jgi:hypothetical protein